MDIMIKVDSPTVSSELTRAFLDAAAVLGLSPRQIAQRADLHDEVVARRGARLPVEQFRAAWLVAERESGPLFGLRAGEAMRAGALDIIDYMMLASATCGAALARLTRYAPLLANAARLSLSSDGDLVRFRYDCPGGLEQTVDFSFAVIAQRLCKLARSGPHGGLAAADVRPRRISFRHARRGELDCYLRIFDAPIGFHQRHNEMLFERSLFELPVATFDPGLVDILEDCANTSLARLALAATPSACDAGQELSAIRAGIRSALCQGDPGIRSAAKLLGMSPRTVQRRLQQHGSSYREVVQQIRADLIAEVLSSEQPTRSRLAQVLAYSSERSVDRACRRLGDAIARPVH
jgi:AraC-like DNA-binding protein